MAGRRSTGAEVDGGRGEHEPGDVVVGVRLSAVVGRGGAGTVWAGTEVASGARVAVKLLHRAGAGREAALLEAVRHPHVLALRRVEADPPALVMDLAAGGSLAAQVAARGTLEPGEVVTVLAPLADCLGALHAGGVVHGDVTATNVLFVDAGRPVLADLGVAGLAGDGAAWATPGYAAPEVVAGARPGPAADVHGLGAAAWLALTGTPMPVAEDRLPLGLLAPGCPAGLAAAVTAAVDPDPAARPTGSELAAAARAACPGLVVRLVPGAALGVRPDEAVTYRVREAAAAHPPEQDGPRWWRRLDAAAGRVLGAVAARAPRGRRRAAVTGAVAAVAAALVVGMVVMVPTGEPGPAARAVPAVPAAPAAPAVEAVEAVEAVAGPADLRGTVLALVEARERALRTGDPAALVQVHDPAGTTLGLDRDLVADGPVDVGYEVLDVTGVDGRPGVARVSLRTSVGTTTSTEAVVLELASGEDGWRVRSVTR